MAVDVSAVVADVASQGAPVVAAGLAVLLVFVGLHAFRWVRSVAVGGGSGAVSPASVVLPFDASEVVAKEDRKAGEYMAAAADHGGVEAMTAAMDAKEAAYSRMWAEQAAPSSGSALASSSLVTRYVRDDPSTAYDSFTSEERGFVDALVSRGHEYAAAVAMVEARADAVSRSVIRARGYE